MDKKKLSLLLDFYELTMANGYLKNGYKDKVVYFDMFFRKVPDGGGFAILAGIAQVLQYLSNLRFSIEDINYLEKKNIFSPDFIEYLRNFKFTCDVWAIKEGTPIFPNEPLVTVRGPIMQAQLIETMILLSVNHQSLITTKANRIVRAAKKRTVVEFGSRRAQGYDGAIYGARAAYIGGCSGTSCTVAEKEFGVPASGTMAHSWIQAFPNEYEAFKAYAQTYPNNCTLLIDTYSVLNSGLPNAIKVFKEVLLPLGIKPKGVRLDSGDLTYLSKKVREILDQEGFKDCAIVASNSLDEYVIKDLLIQGAKIDMFGVGERLITSKSEPVFGGVYKLAAVEENGVIDPRIKLSENVQKINNPGFKQVWRLYNKRNGKAIADVITMHDEVIDDNKPYEIFHPQHTWKRKVVKNFVAKKLLVKVFEQGKQVYKSPSTKEIRDYCLEQMNTLWEEVKRFENPHKYYVDLSQKLWDMKHDLLAKLSSKKID